MKESFKDSFKPNADNNPAVDAVQNQSETPDTLCIFETAVRLKDFLASRNK